MGDSLGVGVGPTDGSVVASIVVGECPVGGPAVEGGLVDGPAECDCL